jgi:pyridoxine kinase
MINQDPGVVTIQSQLVFGHAGNSAAVFPFEYAGIPVCAVPTVLFSNNPHYPSMAGEAIDPTQVRALLEALIERQPPSHTRTVISGFLGGAGVVGRLARSWTR